MGYKACQRLCFAFLLACLLVALEATPLRAGVGAAISGTVLDGQGAVIPHAAVTLLNTATDAQQTVTTNEQGIYSFRALAVGTYELRVALAGFRPYRRTGIVLDSDGALIADVVLQIGPTTDTVIARQTRQPQQRRSLERTELYGSAFAATRRCSADHHHRNIGASCGREHLLSFRISESRHHID
jgi:hypothetical protein